MSIPEGYHPMTFGCGCSVRAAHPWETYEHFMPDLKGLVVRVYRFDSVCKAHQEWATKRSGGRTVRVQPGRASTNRYWVFSGEGLLIEEERSLAEACRAVQSARLMVDRIRGTWLKKQVESWLISKGWTKEGEDEWTASSELQSKRAHRGASRYVRTRLSHAVNTQRLVDGGIPRPEQKELLKQEAWMSLRSIENERSADDESSEEDFT